MRRLEPENRRRVRRANLRAIVLGTVAAAGFLSIAAVAPGVLIAMKKLGLMPKRRQTESINAARKRLVEQGMLKYVDGKLTVTPAGKRGLRKLTSGDFSKKKSKHWDRKWRILIFDIPESRRKLRDEMRLALKKMGFIRLQHSVWIYPYDCEDFIALLKADFRIGTDVLYLIVDALEFDKPYRSHFKLPLG